jgi:hypothetical protein
MTQEEDAPDNSSWKKYPNPTPARCDAVSSVRLFPNDPA